MRVATLIVLFLFTTFAYAGEGSGLGTITTLYVKPNANWVRVNFSNTIKNPDGCDENGLQFYVFELDGSKASDRFYSALLAAYAAKKNISFWISGCSTAEPWGIERPKIYDMYMQ